MQTTYHAVKKFIDNYNEKHLKLNMLDKEDLHIDYEEEYQFSKSSSLRVGGKVALYVRVNHEDALFDLVAFLVRNNINYYILCDGANVIVKDSGYDGIIVTLDGRFKSIFFDGNLLYTNSAVSVERLAHEARIRNLSGLEFATLLTHSISAAIVDNLRAFGCSVFDKLTSLRVLDISKEAPLIKQIKKDDYVRLSKESKSKLVILSVVFKLETLDPNLIDSKIEAYRYIRGSVAPVEPNIGPIFLGSDNLLPYEMVERVGGLDMKVGFMQWHRRLPNYIINTSKNIDDDTNYNKVDDAIALIEDTRKRIESHYDIKPETNITILG